MPSLKEIKGRISSVGSTLKITSAMKMVSAAKLRKAQKAIGNMLPYEEQLQRILLALIGDGPLPSSFLSPETEDAPAKRPSVAYVCFSSNSALCGGFTASVIRKAQEAVRESVAAGAEVTVYSVVPADARETVDTRMAEPSFSGFPTTTALLPLTSLLV